MSIPQATHTANGKYGYSDIIAGKSVDDWVQDIHAYNCQMNGWQFQPLKKGVYGYDNLVMCFYIVQKSINCMITNFIDNNRHIESSYYFSKLVHDAWTENYLFWRDNQPWNRTDMFYSKPFKPLGCERRDMCARTEFIDLPLDEQEKDAIIANYITSKLFDKCIL